jgi:peroxiredoxin
MTVADLIQTRLTANMVKNSKTNSTAPALDCSLNAPEGEAPTTNDLPTTELLTKLNDVPLFDAEGKSHSFRSLYAGTDGGVDRNLIVFLRHFFCANCQEYVRALAAEMSPDKLPSGTRITLISHGAPELIPHYIKETNCPYPLYTDPSRKLYDTLGLAKTLTLGEKPSYVKMSFTKIVISGILQGLSTKQLALKAGNSWQVGGEFLFLKEGDDWKVTWAHRMKTTRDHAPVETLKEILGVSNATATVDKTAQANGTTESEKANVTTVNGTDKEGPVVAAVPQNGEPVST